MLPTPTPMPAPVATQAININASDWSMWSYTDEAIQIWNYNPNLGLVIQWAVIIVIVIAFVGVLIYLFEKTMDER